MIPFPIIGDAIKLITLLVKRRRERIALGLTRKEMRARRRAIRHGEQPAPLSSTQAQPVEAPAMSWLTSTFDSTKNSGFSKKIAVLFITGTVLPSLSALGVNENILTMLGQLAALYLGGQSVVDAGHAFAAAKKP